MKMELKTRDLGSEAVQTVDARELHSTLEIGKDFSTWIKAQIKRAQLLEHRDFVKLTQKGELSTTGQIVTNYHLTIDAAKHISMMSGTAKGFEARDYFICCERKLRQAEREKLQSMESAAQLAGGRQSVYAGLLPVDGILPCPEPGRTFEGDFDGFLKTLGEIARHPIWAAHCEYMRIVRVMGIRYGLDQHEKLLALSTQPMKDAVRQQLRGTIQNQVPFFQNMLLNAVPLDDGLVRKWYAGDTDGYRKEIEQRVDKWVVKNNLTLAA